MVVAINKTFKSENDKIMMKIMVLIIIASLLVLFQSSNQMLLINCIVLSHSIWVFIGYSDPYTNCDEQ